MSNLHTYSVIFQLPCPANFVNQRPKFYAHTLYTFLTKEVYHKERQYFQKTFICNRSQATIFMVR